MDNKEYDMKNWDICSKQREEMKKRGIVVINEPFLDGMLEKVYFDILDISNNKLVDKITIYVNSNGGYETSMFPLIDLISSIKKPVETIAMGKAYSAGAFLVMCGHKGHRKAHRHTEFLLHSGGMTLPKYTKHVQLEQYIKSLETGNNSVINLIRSKTKMKEADIKRFMGATDEFIRADEALRYGIIDEIIGE